MNPTIKGKLFQDRLLPGGFLETYISTISPRDSEWTVQRLQIPASPTGLSCGAWWEPYDDQNKQWRQQVLEPLQAAQARIARLWLTTQEATHA